MPSEQTPKPPERRDKYRIKVEIKALVRLANGGTEICAIQNMTRNGVYFTAFGNFTRGEGVAILFPYDPTRAAQQQFQSAEVVRVQNLEGSFKKGVAVKLLNLFLKP